METPRTMRGKLRRIGVAASAGAALAVALGAAGAAFVLSDPYHAPSFRQVKESYRPSDAVLLDRHGEPLHELRVDAEGRRLAWVALGEVSPSFRKALLRSEDRRFERHGGVDLLAFGAAAADALLGKGRRGASTIPMQLASLLDDRLKRAGPRRTLRRKIEQARAALALGRWWTREEILEAYVNLVPFRGELTGLRAASRGLFRKEPSGLDDSEAVILAALIRSPNARPEAVADRAVRLVGSLGWSVPPEAVRSLAARLSDPYRIAARIDLAPHVARKLLPPRGAHAVASTLDAGLQRFAAAALGRQLLALRGENALDGAALVVENRTGQILAYVGNGGALSSAVFVDGAAARRQAGSTLKPFLYGLALERKILTAASLLEDAPVDVPTEAGMYIPRNYDKVFRGLVSVRTGLSSSLNVPAVRTLSLVGSERLVERLRKLGFSGLREGEDYGMSLALGTADVSLFELANAYRTLANGGVWSTPTLVPRVGRPRAMRVMSREVAFLLSDILSDRGARGAAFGLESPLSTRFWTAVKTGTSKDMRDNWCLGFSERYTVGVWIGNFSGEAMWNVSGVSGAAPAWAEIMGYLHRSAGSRKPVAPPGVVAQRVTFPADAEPERSDWFLRGTEPAGSGTRLARFDSPRIRYPVGGEIIALDPDIPQGRQLLFFETENGAEGFSWILDGRNVGKTPAAPPWAPEPGSHTLSLADREGRVVDSVEFHVRGPVAPAGIPHVPGI